jgi:hypothetical protein
MVSRSPLFFRRLRNHARRLHVRLYLPASLVGAAGATLLACSSSSTALPAAGSDASDSDGAVISCPPVDVSSFSPPPYHAANPPRAACTQDLVDAFYAACLAGSSTDQTCAPFSATGDASHKACAACILSQDTDPTYGPLVQHKGTVSLNLSGCIEVRDAQNGLACAKAYQSSADCDDAACAAKCPVTDDASFTAYKACTQAAASNGCKAYTLGISCAAGEADGGPASVCFAGQSFQDLYKSIVPVFCMGAAGAE